MRPAAVLATLLLVAACASPAAPSASTDASPSASLTPIASIALPSAPPSAAADPSGLEGLIAYAAGMDPQIHLLDLATGESRQLTDLTAEDAALSASPGLIPAVSCGFGPNGLTWSPDGALLAFSYGGCEGVVHVVDLEGTVRRIGDGNAPSWSPDGSSLAFAPNVPFAPCGPGCLDPALGPWEILVADPAGEADPTPLTANGGTFTAGGPRWSPDGSLVAFSGPSPDADPALNRFSAAYVIGADGSGQRLVANGAFPSGWMHDGRLLCVEESTGRFFAVDVDTGDGVPIAEGAFDVVPSPDGSLLLEVAFDAATGENSVHVRPSAGGDVVASVPGSAAAWAPDGSAFLATRISGLGSAIAVHAADGTELGVYPTTGLIGPDQRAVWRPSP